MGIIANRFTFSTLIHRKGFEKHTPHLNQETIQPNSKLVGYEFEMIK